MMKSIRKMINRTSLRILILYAFLLVVLFITVAVYVQLSGFIDEVAHARARGITDRVRQNITGHLDYYLQSPDFMNAVNMTLAKNGEIDLENPEELGRLLMVEVARDPSVDYAYYANENGGIVSSGDTGSGYTISYTEGMKQGALVVNAADEYGNIMGTVNRIPNFDPRTRSWYSAAKETKTNYWSNAYGSMNESALAITASVPLLDASGNVIGVFGADILLNKLSDYLDGLVVTPGSEVFLLEQNGLLVASADPSQALFHKKGDTLERIHAAAVPGVLMQCWDKLAKEETPDAASIGIWKHKISGVDQYLSLSQYSYQGNANINWLVLIVMPERELIEGQDQLYQRLVLMLGLALILSALFGVGISKLVLRPVHILHTSVQEIQNGNWGGQVVLRRKDELGELANSFNMMSATIQSNYETLMQKNQELGYLNTNLEEIVRQRTEDLRKLSITDDLTGLYNHRYIIDFLLKKAEEATRYQYPLSIALFDLDYFKRINDCYGHLKGNEVLIRFAQCLSESVRHTDVVGRYGGEEFLIILPYTPLEEAHAIADRIRNKTEQLTWFGEADVRITVSGGVSVFRHGADTVEKLISRADENLYRAKEGGRNRVEQ